MKNPFIILGIAGSILVLGGGVWLYLFLFYVPAPENVRDAENPFVQVDADAFGAVSEQGEESESAPAEAAPSAGVAITPRRLAGAVVVTGAYRVIEAGTGHAYEITDGGAEHKISNTTFPQTINAVWAPSGERVAITRETDGTFRTFIVTLGADDAMGEGDELSGSPQNIAWSEDSSILKYTRITDAGSQGVAYDVATKKETVLFTTSLRDIATLWNPTPMIVTTATREYSGYAYRSNLTRVTPPMVALSATQNDTLTLFSGITGNSLTSWFVRGTTTVPMDRAMISEKCTLISTGAICASPKQFDAAKYPDNWYRGEEVYDDEVFYVDAETGVSEPLGDLAIPYRTPLDIVRAATVPGGALMQSRDGHVVFVPLTR